MVTKESYITRFKKWTSIKSYGIQKLKVAQSLMQLYAHQPGALKRLEEVSRLNPDFATIQIRDDLEFYIP